MRNLLTDQLIAAQVRAERNNAPANWQTSLVSALEWSKKTEAKSRALGVRHLWSWYQDEVSAPGEALARHENIIAAALTFGEAIAPLVDVFAQEFPDALDLRLALPCRDECDVHCGDVHCVAPERSKVALEYVVSRIEGPHLGDLMNLCDAWGESQIDALMVYQRAALGDPLVWRVARSRLRDQVPGMFALTAPEGF